MKRNRKPSRIRVLSGMLLCLLALTFSGLFARDVFRAAREKSANLALVRQAEATGSSLSDQRNYLPLLQENPDLAAWLTIEGTAIDYPVMYTPDDPQYYLRRAFDRSDAMSGSLFISDGCTPDGVHILIYGHKMQDGTMFGTLDRYSDPDYAAAHPEITYDLIQPDGSYERLTFTVMAAFYSRIYAADEENVFRYYYATDLSSPEAFQSYTNQVLAAALYDTGVRAEAGDRLLTLSTCSYHTKDGRFVVVARYRPGEA